MSLDFAGALRRRKPERRRAALRPRPESALTGIDDAPRTPVAVLVDTNVYIHGAAGRLPASVEALLERALLFHCSVCVAELATGIAMGDPAHPRWSATRAHYAGLVASMPASRVLVPDAQIWSEAGLLAGTLARVQGLDRNARKEALADALVFLTAAKAGLPVLTADRDDFDLLQQLCPDGDFIHYRAT